MSKTEYDPMDHDDTSMFNFLDEEEVAAGKENRQREQASRRAPMHAERSGKRMPQIRNPVPVSVSGALSRANSTGNQQETADYSHSEQDFDFLSDVQSEPAHRKTHNVRTQDPYAELGSSRRDMSLYEDMRKVHQVDAEPEDMPALIRYGLLTLSILVLGGLGFLAHTYLLTPTANVVQNSEIATNNPGPPAVGKTSSADELPVIVSDPGSTADVVNTEAIADSSNAQTLYGRFTTELSTLESMVADGEFDAAIVRINSMDRTLFGYGEPEFQGLVSRIEIRRDSASPNDDQIADAGDSIEAEQLAAAEAAAVEAERLAAEEAAAIEAERLAAEEAATIEAERLAAEEAATIEAERLAAENEAKAAAERIAADDAARVEADRLAKKIEAERIAEARRAAEIAAERLAAERAAREEAQRLASERIARLEAERLAEQVAETNAERAAKAEADRLAAEVAARRSAERAAAIRLAEERQRAEKEAEAAREATRIEAERVAEAKRQADAEARRTREAEATRAAARRAARQRAERLAAQQKLSESVPSSTSAPANTVAEQSSQLARAEISEPLTQSGSTLSVQPLPITDDDLQQVYRRFNSLESAIQNRDIAQVISLTKPSGARVQQFLQIFENSQSVNAQIANVSTRKNRAIISGTLKILNITRADGSVVLPPASLSNITLSSSRTGSQWSVIEW